jgi:hypothetical protein
MLEINTLINSFYAVYLTYNFLHKITACVLVAEPAVSGMISLETKRVTCFPFCAACSKGKLDIIIMNIGYQDSPSVKC